MKKLNLKLGGIGEMLTREQMKKVVGGDYGGPSGCIGSWFYEGDDGCGTLSCSGWADDGVHCICTKTISSPQPCGYA